MPFAQAISNQTPLPARGLYLVNELYSGYDLWKLYVLKLPDFIYLTNITNFLFLQKYMFVFNISFLHKMLINCQRKRSFNYSMSAEFGKEEI